jgi:hypothetical protein
MPAFSVVDELRTLSVPALLMAGDRDRHVPLRNHLATWATIRRCGLHVFHQVGHVPFAEVPEEFDKVLLRFVTNGRVRSADRGRSLSEPCLESGRYRSIEDIAGRIPLLAGRTSSPLMEQPNRSRCVTSRSTGVRDRR